MVHIPSDLIIAQEQVYTPCGFVCTDFVQEKESEEYSACSFRMNTSIILFRVAKITPTKTGQFVTLWKRMGNGPIIPLDGSDSFEKVIISVRQNQRLGQFIFPKSVLCEQGLVSQDAQGGKRALRVYPPWDIAGNKQAQKTQAWQCQYFFEIETDGSTNLESVKRLLL